MIDKAVFSTVKGVAKVLSFGGMLIPGKWVYEVIAYGGLLLIEIIFFKEKSKENDRLWKLTSLLGIVEMIRILV
jgi:hypothetical protein